MKTVCPHCHQKYDVPDDYLQQDVTCQKCEKDFTVTKAKFCAECGKANSAQAFQCHSCKHPFQLEIRTETEDAASQHLVSSASGDRSEAKLSLLLQIVVFLVADFRNVRRKSRKPVLFCQHERYFLFVCLKCCREFQITKYFCDLCRINFHCHHYS